MNLRCYSDHGSPVRRARETARERQPCLVCGHSGEPAMRRPRHFSESWHRCPDTYFGCRSCGHRLAAIDGPAADRDSEVAIDRIPDPSGTVRALVGRDPLMILSLGNGSAGGAADVSDPAGSRVLFRLKQSMGPALEGVELRIVRLPDPGACGSLLLTRFGLPWIPLVIEPVAEIEMPTAVRPALEGNDLIGSATVEAVFAVAIDPAARWRCRQIGPGATSG